MNIKIEHEQATMDEQGKKITINMNNNMNMNNEQWVDKLNFDH